MSNRRYSLDMKESNFPSDKLDKFMLRFPDGMRERIRQISEANARSMNSEIIQRLEASLAGEINRPQTELSADQANQLAKAARENLLSSAKNECIRLISQSASKGLNRADFDFVEFAGLPDNIDLDKGEPLYQKLVIPLVTYLTELGYKVVVDGNDLFIDF